MGRVVVLGSSNLDLTIRVEELPKPGETVIGSDFQTASGGKGANQAVAAARAGAQVVFLDALGEDAAGRELENSLKADGVDLTHLQRLRGVASGAALILVNRRGENQIAVAPGANHRISTAYVENLPPHLFTAPGVFVSQLETPPQVVLAGLQLAKSRGMTTILNPAPADVVVAGRSWATAVDVLIVNQTEAAILGGVPAIHDDGQAREIAAKLRSLGFGDVVVTLGQEGYAVYSKEGVVRGRGVPVQAVDAVGAGDVFVGAIACALAEGRSLPQAASWANRAAALSVTRPGAQPAIPKRAEIDAFHPAG